MKTKRILTCAAMLCVACQFAKAQLLSDFSAFYSPDYTFFSGDWSSGNDAPLASFSQGEGFYEIKGGTNNSLSKVEFYFGSGGNYESIAITGDYLTVSASLLSGSAAPSFTVYLVDESVNYVSATFSTAAFGGGSFTTVSAALSTNVFFDASSVSFMIITGDATGASAAFNIAFDNIAVTAVPEPATYAIGAGAVALLGALYRRRRMRG